MDPTQRCFSIEREGALPEPCFDCSLANFKDKFVFLFSNEGSYRYSLAEHKWEDLPSIPIKRLYSACSHGDKIYVLDRVRRAIKVLHNPDAPVSSQEMHWQRIKVPGDIPIPYHSPAFAPLNLTEIAIAGGMDKYYRIVAYIVTFDTTTCEFKKEVAYIGPFKCFNS